MPLDISVKLASLLLRHKGELSRSDIAALPWVENEDEVELIISMILRDVDAELQQRRIESSLIPDWEDVVVVKSASSK